jgi:hypothetical protein
VKRQHTMAATVAGVLILVALGAETASRAQTDRTQLKLSPAEQALLSCSPRQDVTPPAGFLERRWKWTDFTRGPSGVELTRFGYDTSRIKIFGSVRLYVTASIQAYGTTCAKVAMQSKLIDCNTLTMENWPSGVIVTPASQGEYREKLEKEFLDVCHASKPTPLPRPVGE